MMALREGIRLVAAAITYANPIPHCFGVDGRGRPSLHWLAKLTRTVRLAFSSSFYLFLSLCFRCR